MTKLSDYMCGLFIGVAIGSSLMNIADSIIDYYDTSRFPQHIEEVQKDYVAPSKIEEIVCEDLDHNGEKETIVKIDGKAYLLMYKDGKPTLLEYTIQPAEIIPQK